MGVVSGVRRFDSLVVETCAFLVGWIEDFHSGPDKALMNAAKQGANTTTVVFWVVLALLYLTHISKSAAMLDCERRVRLAEELYRQGYSRTNEAVAEMIRSSTPGAKGPGKP